MSYKIKNIGPDKEITTNNGTFKVYSLQFDGDESWVELMQKPTTPAPTVGQELEGTIETTQYGKRFKRVQAAGSFQGGRTNDPETRGSIERQSALKAAVDTVQNHYVTTGDKPGTLPEYRVEVLITAKEFAGFLANANPGTTIKADDNQPPAENYNEPA